MPIITYTPLVTNSSFNTDEVTTAPIKDAILQEIALKTDDLIYKKMGAERAIDAANLRKTSLEASVAALTAEVASYNTALTTLTVGSPIHDEFTERLRVSNYRLGTAQIQLEKVSVEAKAIKAIELDGILALEAIYTQMQAEVTTVVV